MNKKYSMTAATAAAAGVDLTGTEALDPTDVAGAGAAMTEGTEGLPPEGSTEAGGTEPGGEAGTGVAIPDITAVALLKEQAAASADALMTARVELTGVQKELEALKATLEPLAKVVALATNNMSVALGGTADPALMTAPPAEVLSRHSAVASTFTETFKVGGVAAVEGEDTSPAKKAPANSAQEAARLSLVKPNQPR